MIDPQHGWNVSYKPQFIGFILSMMLIISAYRIVTHHHLSEDLLTLTLIGLALGQAVVQLVFFLHLGLESKPRWNMLMFLFTVMVILIVLGGSLWIMDNLDYNLMPKMEHH